MTIGFEAIAAAAATIGRRKRLDDRRHQQGREREPGHGGDDARHRDPLAANVDAGDAARLDRARGPAR